MTSIHVSMFERFYCFCCVLQNYSTTQQLRNIHKPRTRQELFNDEKSAKEQISNKTYDIKHQLLQDFSQVYIVRMSLWNRMQLYAVQLRGVPSDGGQDRVQGFSFQQTQFLQGVDAHSRMGKLAHSFTHLTGTENVSGTAIMALDRPFNYGSFTGSWQKI